MKNTRICPKCQSPDILRMEDRAGSYGVGKLHFQGTRFLDFRRQ